MMLILEMLKKQCNLLIKERISANVASMKATLQPTTRPQLNTWPALIHKTLR
jgi:hypothetical protein